MPEPYDITGKVGPLWPLPFDGKTPEIPMYSFERPAQMLWNEIGKALSEKGWSDEKIAEWLRSKETRWALDGSLGDSIKALARAYVETELEPALPDKSRLDA